MLLLMGGSQQQKLLKIPKEFPSIEGTLAISVAALKTAS